MPIWKGYRHHKLYHWYIQDGDKHLLFDTVRDIKEQYPLLNKDIIQNNIIRKKNETLERTKLPDKLKKLRIKRIRIPKEEANMFIREILSNEKLLKD